MTRKLLWDMLFSGDRERESSTYEDHRNEFDKDYDRIVYSSSVRRLQDKAQVFPLQENDFTRTRLTHSIEASALARSLGLAVEKWLIEEKIIQEEYRRYLPSLLQVSALIHDLGNPPFGHYGEDVIRKWFKNWFESDEYNGLPEEIKLKDEEKSDFINFEGNAQTLRIVTKLQMINDQYGVNFTYGTLATIMKYPWTSSNKSFINKYCEKFGYFQSEKGIAKRIQKATGLKDGVRHPATFLLEAADDIAYLCADMEDAVKKGIIPWTDEYNSIKDKLIKSNKELYNPIFHELDKRIDKVEADGIPDKVIASVQNFKFSMQGLMCRKVVDAFKDNYDLIMEGKFEHKPLVNNCGLNDLVKELERLAKDYCFVDKEVLILELVGDKVINGLLDIFVSAFIKCNKEPKSKNREGKLYEIISDNFKYICKCDYEGSFKQKDIKHKNFTDIKLYDKLLLITDFISGMTDSYAVKLYKELMGVELP